MQSGNALVFSLCLSHLACMILLRSVLPVTVALLLLAAPVALASSSSRNSSTGVSQDYANILENRLQALEEQVQRLTNQVEQANFQAQQAQTRLQRLEEDLNTRFRMLEDQRSGSEPAPVAINNASPNVTFDRAPASRGDQQRLGELTTSPDGSPSVNQPDDPNTAYDQAFSKIRDGDYEAAESGMRSFIQRWPRHELASNASYWVGETFYARGDYEHAAKSFAESYQKYPRGAKAEDTLVKLALTLSALNRTNDACVTFEQAEAEFPRMSTSNRRRVDQERTQLDCPAASSGR